MTQLEIGYLAGIIDGEGTITLTKDKEFRFPTIAVASCTLGILEEIKRICDGGVITSKKTYKVNHSPSWAWKIERWRAIAVLEEITPYLKEPKKKARAELILRDYTRLTPRNGKYTEHQRIEKHQFEDEFFAIE